MRRHTIACFGVLFCTFTLAAQAHVGVFPREGKSGERHQFFTVRAPVEKDIPNTELRIEIPPEWKAAGGKVDRVLLDPQWKVTLDKDQDEWIKGITWSGVDAPAWAFMEFGVIITLPKLTGMQQIKAFQKYSDGSVVGWIEDATKEGVENPAARLTLVEGNAPAGGAAPAAAAGMAGGAMGYGLSGLIGGLVGAGLVLMVRKKA